MPLMEEKVFRYEAFAANIFNKQSRTDTSEWFSSLAARHVVNNSSPLL
jgi:hypothetical protein